MTRRPASSAAPIAVVIPVGPKPLEVERLADFADALATYETGPGWLVMVDDVAVPRQLDELVRPKLSGRSRLTPVSLHHRREGKFPDFRDGGGLCSSVLMALQWVQANTDAHVVLKLDTDSLVIGHHARQRLVDLFDANPDLGMAGAYSLTPNRTHRDWTAHARTIHRMVRGEPFDWRRPWQSLNPEFPDDHVTRLIHTALDRGYEPGEHCLGGGYALPRTLLDRMAAARQLDEPMSWINVDMAEDVMVGVHVRAVGMTLANHCMPGDVFGVRYQGLPAAPAALLEQGYAIIHSVKNDPRVDEATIRAFLKTRRTKGIPPAKPPVPATAGEWRSSTGQPVRAA